tara:strand:+ start:1104 stop:1436 length:333 start_codon:yes stop_codon:yes gene_type:complete
MKKIKLTVASILLSGVCFAQTSECCQKTAQEVYEYEGLTMNQSHWTEGKVVMDKFDHLEAINTVEDLIEWINYDVKSDDIKPCIGVGYLENLNALLLRLKNKSILIENED